MPMLKPADTSLSNTQKMRFRANCQYLDKLLSDLEDILHSSERATPFPKYQMDIQPDQAHAIQDFVLHFRKQLVSTLALEQIDPPGPEVPATRAIDVNLNFIDITLADMRPSSMRGAGALSDEAAEQLSRVVSSLSSMNRAMMQAFEHDSTQDSGGEGSSNDNGELPPMRDDKNKPQQPGFVSSDLHQNGGE